MHESPSLFCTVVKLTDLYLMTLGKEEGGKELKVHEDRFRCVGAEGFVGQTGQFKFYSKFNR